MDGNNIQGLNIFCFGHTYKNKDPNTGWLKIANSSQLKGWNNINIDLLQESLASDLKIGSHALVAAQFKDVGTDTIYTVYFSNKEKKWKIKIPNSKSLDGVPPEDKKIFFNCQLFTNTCKKVEDVLEKCKNIMETLLMDHLTRGELSKINETEYKTVLDCLKDPELIKNLKLHKYI